MSIFSLYLVSILDNLRIFLFLALTVSIIIMLLGLNYAFDEAHVKDNNPWGATKLGFFMFILSGIFLIITPTTKSAAAVIAGHAVLEFASGEHTKSIISKSSQILDKFLDDQIKNEKRD